MKKFTIFAFMLVVLLPIVSYAGSATSRWDLNIGGHVKFDAGWASQAQGGDYWWASPESVTGNVNIVDEYSNSFMASGETRLSFAVKGPEAWGAKTSAFIEGDFRQTGAYEAFRLRHAYLRLNWKNTQRTIGQTNSIWASMGTFNVLGINEMEMAQFGRIPQITVKTKFMKNWSITYGLVSSYKSSTAGGASASTGVPAVANQQSIFSMPFFEGALDYESDSLGKIGPRKLTFGLGGFVGQYKIARRSGAAGTYWKDDDVSSWGLAFRGFVPIIPEKKSNKAGSLALTGVVLIAQGPTGCWCPVSIYDGYIRASSIDAAGNFEARTPTMSSGWGELTYYFANNIFANFLYGTTTWNYSSTVSSDLRYMNSNRPKTLQHYIVNLMYDVNPAIRLGIEYTHVTTGWTRVQAAGSGGRSGSLDAARIGVYYFF